MEHLFRATEYVHILGELHLGWFFAGVSITTVNLALFFL